MKTNARVRLEQNVDLLLKYSKLNLIRKPRNEVLLTIERQFKHQKANEDRIVLKDGLLFWKNNGESGRAKELQNLNPKQLVDEVLQTLHAEIGEHSGNTKTIRATGEN